MARLLLTYSFLLLLTACGGKVGKQGSLFPKDTERHAGVYDLEDIVDAGSLIVGTLSGPDSYYEMGDEPMGVEYALAEDFASGIGVAIRMEIYNSEEELMDRLHAGEIDLAAYPLARKGLMEKGLKAVVVRDSAKDETWAVGAEATDLAEALEKWAQDRHEEKIIVREREREEHRVVRIPRPQFLSQERGVLSSFDDIFRDAARAAGTDWRLLAAVAYVESRFDPMARSSAGAIGVMQLMPRTAKALGVADATDPEQNIRGGARHLRQLTADFADARNADERLKFVLASYNAGAGHVRDAMMLARKHGKNPQNWTDVSEFILLLSRAEYYRDPVVRHGYMRGTETYNYVPSVLSAYRAYGGSVAFIPGTFTGSNDGMPQRKATPNRFTKGTRIISADDSTFTSLR